MYIISGLSAVFIYVICAELFSMPWDSSEPLPRELEKTNSNVLIGKWRKGKLFHNFNKHAHMLVAGHTGYGKTNFIKTLLPQLNGEIILIDLKGGFDYDFVTASEIHEAENVLSEVVANMRQRRKQHIYVIVDEAYEIVVPKWATTKSEKEPYLKCQQYVSEIARLGRTFKVHLIYCTQYPTREVLDGQIKQNMESRIILRLPTDIASRVALDEEGAEELPAGVPGRGIYKKDYKIEMQCYEYTDRERGDEVVKIRTSENTRNRDTIEIGEVEHS